MPQPMRLFGSFHREAVFFRASMISMFVAFGWASQRQAHIPANTGEEKEVPLARVTESVELATASSCPIAMRVGLIRPSKVGPTELNEALVPKGFTAPTVRTLSPSAGAPIHGKEISWPLFPALFTTRIPLLAAISAPRVEMQVFPFISE